MPQQIPDWIEKDDYFFSAHNPIANADQVWVEQAGLRMLARDDVKQAIMQCRFMWAAVSETASDQAKALLDDFIPEWGANYALKACNSDANHPRVVQNWMLAHTWFGHTFPAARIGGDNPDNGYRLIPVEHGGHYRIDGKRLNNGPADVTWTIVANSGTSMTLDSLDNEDLVVNADGTFTVTVDDQPANGRRNHLQTQRGALFLFIRDALGDWDRERANALRVTRLNPTAAAPISDDEMAWRMIDFMIRDVSLYHWFTALSHGKPANGLVGPQGSGGVGGLRSQYALYGDLEIADDEVFVLKVNGGNASFRDIVVHDWWHRSIKPDTGTGSLDNAQMAPDEDGNFTFAIGPSDPGLHNWLDTGGLHETILLHRWQGVPRATAAADLPKLFFSKVVKLSDIVAQTPGAKRVTPEQRAEQIARRQASYAGRLAV